MEIESDPRKRGFGKIVLVVDNHAPIRKMLATAFLSMASRSAVRQEMVRKLDKAHELLASSAG